MTDTDDRRADALARLNASAPPSEDILTTHARLADLRIRVMNGDPVSPAEYRDLLMDLRRHRQSAAAASAKARRTVTKSSERPQLDLDTLFGGSEC